MPQADYIILIDPDPNIIQSLTQLLTDAGHRVVVAKDGEEAFSMCEKELPKLVITEGLIPKLNGIELAKKIRALPDGGDVSLLLISAIYSGAKFRPEIEEAQIDEVLAKPFSERQVMTKVRALLFSPETKESVETEKAAEFPHTGAIADQPFIRIVYYLHSQKASGTLRLQNGDAKKLVTFEHGEPKFVVSNMEKECLGQVLVKKGRLSLEECQKSLEAMAQLGKRQGETLIQLGMIEPYELEEALKTQAREKFCEIFAWREGQYLFVPGKSFKKDLTPVDLSVPQLCLRGVKEHYSLGILEDGLGSHMTETCILNRHGAFKLEDFKLATWDMRVTREIQMGKSLSDILKLHLARDIDVFHLFFTFISLDVVRFKSIAKVEVSAPRLKEKAPPPAKIPQTPFEVLGVSVNASDDEIRLAYEKKLEGIAKREKPQEELRELRDAYAQISILQGRRDYLIRTYQEELKLFEGAREIFKPAELIEIGKKFLERKDAAKASRVFQDGVGLFPDEGMFYSYLGYALYRETSALPNPDPVTIDRAKKAMIKGAQLAKEDATAHYHLGRVFALEKDYENAEAELSKAVSLNPKLHEAATELRLVQMRKEKQKNTSFIKWK